MFHETEEAWGDEDLTGFVMAQEGHAGMVKQSMACVFITPSREPCTG